MSLKRRLITLVLGVFIIAWLALIGFTAIKAHHEVDELFDANLTLTAKLLSQYALAAPATDGSPPLTSRLDHEYEHKVWFQLWRDDRLVSRSGNAPETLSANGPGFAEIRFHGEHWRVFGKRMSQREILYVAESHEIRDELVEYLVWGSVLPIVWLLPLAGVFVWLAVGRALRPLRRVAGEIDRRSPNQLEPLPEHAVPREIQPITNRLNRLFERLIEAFERERRFTSDAAHELRTPLAVIKTHAQVAARSASMDQARQSIDRVIQGVDRGAHLVSQLLTLARFDPEHPDIEFSPCSLADIAAELITEMEAIAAKKSVSLSLQLDPPSTRGNVGGYEAGLRILLRNLLDNAIKYSGVGSKVKLKIRESDSVTRCTVVDDGPGIPQDERQRVLERFYRPAGQRQYGAGLGLSIVSRICELHGATLELWTGEGGRGLSVDIRFSAAAERISTA